MTATTELVPLVFPNELVEYLGEVYIIDKIMQINYGVRSVRTGKPYKLRITKHVKKSDHVLTEKEKLTLGIGVEKPAINWSDYETGVVVILADESKRPSGWNYKPGQEFVCVKHNFERVNIFKLGGDNRRYWRMRPDALTIVEVN